MLRDVGDTGGATGLSLEQPSSGRLPPEVVRSLFVCHSAELRAFLVGVLRDPSAAQDVSQVAFQRLIELGHTVRKEAIKGWLFKVAMREALAYRRHAVRQDRHLEKYSEQNDLTVLEGSPTERLVRTEDSARIARLLSKLPDDQRYVLRQRIYEEKTFAEIRDRKGVERALGDDPHTNASGCGKVTGMVGERMRARKSQMAENDDLDWLATQYVLGELSDSDRDEFERRLVDDLAACEAVAAANQLSIGIHSAFAAVSVVAVHRKQTSRRRGWGVVIAAASIAIAFVGAAFRFSDTKTLPLDLADVVARWRADVESPGLEVDESEEEVVQMPDLDVPNWLIAGVSLEQPEETKDN